MMKDVHTYNEMSGRHLSNQTATDSLLFIPDISGFTHFVNRTEIDHSKHIIEELLELLIEANQLDMKVSEIEGDAILFFQSGSVPSVQKLVEQAKHMFVKFHSHLRRYERDRICQCGACSTAINLTIKFIAHTGPIQYMKVKDFLKPYGPGVIIAHRLLKNNLNLDEYLLVSGKMARSFTESGQEALPYKLQGKIANITLEDIGVVDYHYLELGKLHSYVKDPPPLENQTTRIKTPVTASIAIPKNIYTVYEIVADLRLRENWVNAKHVEYDPNTINKSGTKHLCVFDSNTLEFEAIKKDPDGKQLVYAEKVYNIPMVEDYTIYFFFQEESETETQVKAEAHFTLKKIPKLFIKPFFKFKLKGQLNNMLQNLKGYCIRIK